MTFKNKDDLLEKRVVSGELSETELNRILHTEEGLPEPTKTVLGYLRDIATIATTQSLDEHYAIFGGYGVLAHLVREYGDGIIKLWRGSEDIDIIGDEQFLNSIKSGYEVHSARASPNIEDKITLKVVPRDGSEGVCKIDYMMSDKDEIEGEEIEVLGVPVRAVSPVRMIRSKVRFYDQEDKQRQDVAALLGVCEHRGISAEDLIAQLSHDEHVKMNEFLRGYKSSHNKRFTSDPSEDYIDVLKAGVKSRALE